MKELIVRKLSDNTIKKLFIVVSSVFAGLVLFGLSFFIYDLIANKRPLQIDDNCEVLKGFVLIQGDKRIPIRLPYKIKAKKSEKIILEATLPENISDDTWIDYYDGRETKIYIDGELRKEFNPKADTLLGGAVKSVHMYIKVKPEDSLKTLRIESYGKSFGDILLKEVYIGNSLGLVERILFSDGLFLVFTITLLIVAPITIFIGIFLWIYKKSKSPITAIGVCVLFVALWLIFDSQIYQFAFRNYYIDGTMSYIMMLLVPFPFLYYLNSIQKKRYRQQYIYMSIVLETAAVAFFIVHFTGLCDFLTMLPVRMTFTGSVIVIAAITLYLDFRNGKYKEYRFSFIGLVGFLVSCIFEIIFLVAVENRHDGSFIIFGLYWTLILGIVHQLVELREAKQGIAIAVRANETKSNFLANMSHEIRTPMNAILGMDEMILREAKNNEKIKKYATDIKSAGNMLLAIINDILDLSKIESGKAELIETDFDICSVINDLINITRKKALDKDLEYSFDADPNLPARMRGDEIRIRQVMLNVMNNAVKYTNKGGVKINVLLEPNVADEKAMMIVSVKDTGIGIKEEDKEYLFESFARLEETKNRNVEGTGLGLNIANKFIEMMGGYIEVESKYNEGSKFTLYIPVTVVDPTPIGDFTDAIARLNEGKQGYKTMLMAPGARVLVVDDNEMNLEVICGLMESTKIKVDTALSGQEGIDRMDKARYDLILLDQMMPEMDGVTTLENMRAKYDMRGISVIALTADAVAGAKEFYLSKGFDGYLSKPVKAEELEKALIKYLPKNLLLSKEEMERIQAAEEKKRLDKEKIKTMVVIDPDSEALKEIKEKTDGIYKGTFVTDMEKAGKYLDKHDADYVLIKKDLYLQSLNKSE